MINRVLAYNLFLLLFLYILSSTTAAATKESSATTDTPKIQAYHKKLENGLNIYVIPNHRIPAVMHMLWYKVGGTNDPIGKSGLAHFLEHLMFNGTKKFKDISTEVNSIGGQFNAMTSSDFTAYYELVPKGKLSLVMEIESDRMRNVKITNKQATKEQNIVLEERKMRIDNSPSNLLIEEMENVFYHNGYGRPVAGWENEIHNLDEKAAKKFYNKYYNPNNAILLVVGDVTFDEVIKLAEKHYGKIKSGHLVEKRFPIIEPKHKSSDKVTLESSEVKIPSIFIWYHTPSRITGNNYLPIALATNILGYGKSSILYDELVVQKNLAASVYASYNDLVYGDSMVTINVTPNPNVSLQTIEKEVNKIIKTFVSHGITEEELKSAKYKYKAEKIYSLDNLTSIAYFYGLHTVLGIPLNEIDISHKSVDNIKIENVNTAIKNIFSTDVKLTGYLLPKSEEKSEVAQ